MTRDLGHLTTLDDQELFQTLRIDPEKLERAREHDPNATIEPDRSADAVGLEALRALAEGSAGRTLSNGLEMKKTLGEGGMGVVHLAVQRSLGREVAVKTLRPDARSEASTLRLVREAWVTGSLEHPNVVPVYDLSLDDQGAPVIVLKRIEGVSWNQLMHDADEVKRRFGAPDALEWNLGILVRLCSAVALAHSRGILHRDLKPENVMIGSFGEVYLVDWGIAVTTHEDPTGRMPTSTSDLAGTPAYMAPEMFGLDGGRITERSDVYLLGGILHEILTGDPPHRGSSIRSLLVSAALSKFSFPESAPKPLVAIAERALALRAEDRFASVLELQGRIEWYQRHRGSLAISEEAGARLAELIAIVRGATSPDAEKVHRLFSECRFGFRAALRASEDNDEARAGLRAATEVAVRFELARGEPEAAAAALAELTPAPEELARAVTRSLDAKRLADAELARVEENFDTRIGQRTRLFFVAVFGTVWTVGPIFGHFKFARSPEALVYGDLVVWSVAMASLLTVFAVWARESMLKTILNRATLALLFMLFASQLAMIVGGKWLRVAPHAVAVQLLLIWAVIAAAIGVMAEPKVRVTAYFFFGAFFVAALAPQWVWLLMSASIAACAILLVLHWRDVPLRDRRPY